MGCFTTGGKKKENYHRATTTFTQSWGVAGFRSLVIKKSRSLIYDILNANLKKKQQKNSLKQSQRVKPDAANL